MCAQQGRSTLMDDLPTGREPYFLPVPFASEPQTLQHDATYSKTNSFLSVLLDAITAEVI